MFLYSSNEYKSFFFFSWLYKYKGFIIDGVGPPVVGGGLRARGFVQLSSYSVKF